MSAILTILTIAAFGLSIYWALNHLPGMSAPLSPGPYWQYFYFQMPLLILPVVLGLHVFNAASSHLFEGVTDAELVEGSVWVVYGALLFSFSLAWCTRLIGGWSIGLARIDDKIVVSALALSLPLLMLAIYLNSGELAILYLGDADIGVVRKQLTTDAEFSPYFGSALTYLGYFAAAYAGHLAAAGKRIFSGATISLGVLALAWSGAKAPPIVGLLTCYFAYVFFSKRKVNILRLVGVGMLGLVGIYLMFMLTRPDMSPGELAELMAMRLFLGQMSGFYQAISFSEPDARYIAPWVPFSGLLGLSQTPYARDLMLQLYGNTDSNGYLNSIFLQDAWAGLGYWGLVISPVWMSLAVAVAIRILTRVLERIGSSAMVCCAVFSFLNVNTLTASFGQMAFLKALYFPLALFSILFVGCLAAKQLRSCRGA